MVNLKSTRKSAESLSMKAGKLVVEEMGLPCFSAPYIGSRYIGNTLRIMVLFQYQFCVKKSDFIKAKDAAYNRVFFKKVDSLLENSNQYRMRPYLVECSGFDLNGILDNVDKNMSFKDVVIHRFVPYPKIKDIDNPVPDVVYEKAVNLLVRLIDMCQPTHILIASDIDGYKMDENFRRFRDESLIHFFNGRNIKTILCGDELQWDYYSDFYDDPIESVPYCAIDLLEDVESAKIALDDSRLRPALYWDDEKIERYGLDKDTFRHFKYKPDFAKQKLLDENLKSAIRHGLIQPFINVKYGKILYTKFDCLSQVYGEQDKEDWKRICEKIALHDEYVKSCGRAIKVKRDFRERAKIRFLSMCMKYSFMNLSKNLCEKNKSKSLAELGGFIEELCDDTDKMYSVRKPICQNSITEKQKVARSMNAYRATLFRLEKRAEKPKNNADDAPIKYKPKKISQKQLDHLARIRLKRWPKSQKSGKSV